MTILGSGLAPAGLSFAGYGVPGTIKQISRQDLIISEGPYKGLVGDCRLIDPISQDYKYNDNGYMTGGVLIQQQVYLALLTVKGSSSQSDLGQSFTNVRIISSDFLQKITQEVNDALSFLISSQKISLDNVVAVRDPNNNNMVRIDIQWTDLQRNVSITNTIL